MGSAVQADVLALRHCPGRAEPVKGACGAGSAATPGLNLTAVPEIAAIGSRGGTGAVFDI